VNLTIKFQIFIPKFKQKGESARYLCSKTNNSVVGTLYQDKHPSFVSKTIYCIKIDHFNSRCTKGLIKKLFSIFMRS
jgi:hypothetical protein